jgi:Zn-finger domain-containing protein
VLRKVNNRQKNSIVEIIPRITRSIIYKVKIWKILMGKREITFKKLKRLLSCGRKAFLENGRP